MPQRPQRALQDRGVGEVELQPLGADQTPGVARDPVNGWDYDPETNKVTFYGEACALIQNGQVEDIDIVFGCELPIPG